jgi:hypothetical protein
VGEDRAGASGPDAHRPIDERVHDARWNSPTPVTDLTSIAAELAAGGESLDLPERLALAELVVSLRAVDEAMPTAGLLVGDLDNPWVRQQVAELMVVGGRSDFVDALVRGEVADLATHDVDLQRRWLHLAARRGPAILRAVAAALDGSSALDGTVVEIDLGDPLPGERRDAIAQELAQKPRMDVVRARATVEVLAGRAAAGARFRSHVVDWSAFDTYASALVTRIVDEALAAADDQRGFSALRLGDGEAQVLAGVMPDITGVLGVAPDGEWNELDADEYAAFRERLAAALRAADVVGVPDLAQCLTGPVGYGEVTALCLEVGVSPDRILPGGSDFGWALELSGEIDRLLARCAGIIGPIDPRDLRRVPLAVAPTWLSVPGELLYYDDDRGRATSHWSRLEAIVGHNYLPGEVWLVGAGVLGKLYCHAVQQAGAVAVDVGSVFDVWSGRQDTRGTVRAQPWVAAPYVVDRRTG